MNRQLMLPVFIAVLHTVAALDKNSVGKAWLVGKMCTLSGLANSKSYVLVFLSL